ncbi:Structural maintenance of chromosomes protein 4 [Trichoplax sp. H2]|nr:Structural maintenance of chromosomes protein 4 [Trichoplax sp. H2]|eukprot:RDD47674.1 Structural maintenance of chromosomes protein 4 [Trichoplax sp. H2]
MAESRLMITHIVNENFKSYAGKKVLGPFDKNFTAIVGPNGSGKSNVIDAMLFVFGYRANKMRSKKIAVLIHNSEKHLNIDSCTVSVHFQKIIDKEGDDYEVIPDSQFVVSRTAYKDSTSSYHLNGKKTPFKEIATLLKSSGIDLDHNRFLILQGEVEQIALMKPKAQTEHDEGMLEFLEDIIGSSQFKETIEERSKNVDDMNEARSEKLNRVKAVEKEKDDLEGIKNEACEYIDMENNKTKLKHKLLQKYVYEVTEKNTEGLEKRDAVMNQLQGLQESITQNREKTRAAEKELKKKRKHFDQVVAELEKCKNQYSELERLDVKLREDLKHSKSKDKKFEKALQKEKQKLEELLKVPDKCQKEIQSSEEAIAGLETKRKVEEENLQVIIEGLKSETQDLQVEKEGKEKELLELNKIVYEAKSNMDVAQSELDIFLSAKKQTENSLKQIKENYENTIKDIAARKKDIKEMEKCIPNKKEKLNSVRQKLKETENNEIDTKNNLRSSRSKLEEMRGSMQASKSRNEVLTALLKEKKEGRINGIYGRLGDLGSINQKYDVAISTACGALDHVVVDTLETAQACIKLLKEKRIGLVTLLALDKIEKLRPAASSKISTPENVPRLFDLVNISDKKFLTAFYFALRDTLVADDLDQATRIAFKGNKRQRVVTLAGHLIDQSGTMSGGGNRVIKGRMSSKLHEEVSPQDLKKLENDHNSWISISEKLQRDRKELEETEKAVTTEISTLEYEYEKCKMEVKSLSEQQTTMSEQLKQLEAKLAQHRTKDDSKRQGQLESALREKKAEYEKLEKRSSKVEEVVKRLHTQIMEIGGTKLKVQQERLDKVINQIDQANATITKSKVAIKTNDKNLNKCREAINKMEKELTENTNHVKDVMAQLEKLEDDAVQNNNRFNELDLQRQEKVKELDTLTDGAKIINDEENESKNKEIELKHELEKLNGELKEAQQKIKSCKKQLESMKLNRVVKGEVVDDDTQDILPEISIDELKGLDTVNLQYQITVLEERLQEMKPNMAAITEYFRKEEVYLTRVSELDEITEQRNERRRELDQLKKERLDMFMHGFEIISSKLKEMYQMLTLGGDADLELVDSLDPFSEGIAFSVRPPKKSWKNISNLSGGEKTLSSLALVFALHHFKPSPLYVMDEIDAALDFKNVSIVANYIKERTKNAQFIIISLRNNMFELADRLIGIYKTDNATKTVVIDPRKIAAA